MAGRRYMLILVMLRAITVTDNNMILNLDEKDLFAEINSHDILLIFLGMCY